ncbi:MAG: hypothetical protein Q7U34_14675 [Anaerolineales bacterium]|nr:hypothetical protein [Anaerolineales bacterium]MDO9348080.1 hypothetical protein [Anaerolineales bacterium]MDP3186515.1 hypothetical protein [Anaerolineales bacterium]
MSKKSKRQANRPASASVFLSGRTEFNPDYSIVKRELKRIGVLAGSFLIILIVLALFQNQILALFLP